MTQAKKKVAEPDVVSSKNTISDTRTTSTVSMDDYTKVVDQLDVVTSKLAEALTQCSDLQKEVDALRASTSVNPNAYVITVELANRPAKVYNIVVFDGVGSIINAYGSRVAKSAVADGNKVISIQPTMDGMLVEVDYKGGIFQGVGNANTTRQNVAVSKDSEE